MNRCKYLMMVILMCLIKTTSYTQWVVTERTPMPEAVSNHALVAAEVNGLSYVYTFGGIDTSKLYSGIHARCYKYDVQNDQWTRLPDLPDGVGRIAAAADYLNGKIYVVGGYEVFSNGHERSLRTVHVFDPVADTFLADAHPIIFPIDDHVQGVWRDSLLYVIAGWSNTGNLYRTQLYNPASDEWSEATSIPNNNNFKAFGASGVIIGDTIYYIGGAADVGLFPAVEYFRKGAIDPSNPSSIKWTSVRTHHGRGYRTAPASIGAHPMWIGGSLVTYNYNGIAYDGSGGVEPLSRIKIYHSIADTFETLEGVFPARMDYRGIGKINENSFVLTGGMEQNQIVSDRVFLLQSDQSSIHRNHEIAPDLDIYPNPISDQFYVSSRNRIKSCFIRNAEGQTVGRLGNYEGALNWIYGKGIFLLEFEFTDGRRINKKIVAL